MFRDGRHGRRNGDGRRSCHRARSTAGRHLDGRSRDEAVRLRGQAAHAVGRGWHRAASRMRGYGDRHPKPEPLQGRRRQDDLRGCLRHGGPSALCRCWLHHRPHREGGIDQSRLRRCARGDARHGPGDDGDGRVLGRRPKRRSQTRFSTRRRWAAPEAYSSRSPVDRT